MAIKPFNSIGGISLGTDSRQALNADGSANFASLEVGNTANLNGQVFVNNTLAVSNAASFGETVLINGVLTATANVDVQAELNVTGNIVTLANMGVGGDLSTTGNLSVTGTSTLGDVGNVHISGGASGQYLQTNGSGNLSWVTLDTDTLANGSSNVSIDSTDGPVTIGVNGSSNIAKFNQSNIEFTDGTNTAFTFDLAAKFLTMIDAADNQVGVAPTEIALNSTNGDYMTQLLSGAWSLSSSIDANLPQTYITPGFISTYYGDINGGPVMPTNPDHLTTKAYVDNKGYIANGSSNVSIDSTDGDVTVSVDGSSNVAVFTSSGLIVNGSLGASSVSGDGASLSNITGANVTGDVAGANHANIADVANSVAGANVSGTVGSASVAYSVDGANVSGDVAGANRANVAFSVAGANVVGNVAGASMAYALSTDVSNLAITGGANGLVLTTNGSGALSWTNSNVKYSREIHVDSTLGNDTTGDGSYNRPYATIMKAHSMISSGVTVFLHVGSYSENVTWTKTNTDIIGLSEGGMVNCTGNWIVGTTVGASVRIKDVAINGTFTQNGTGRLIVRSSYLRSTFTKTSGEYTQFDDTDASGTGISIASAGTVVFNGGTQNLISVSNAGAVVSINNTIGTASITVTAGTVVASDSYIYALTNTGNAVTTSAGTAVYLYNSHCIAPNQTIARISMGGFWTANDTQYDKANSTLTGTNLGTISYFDALSSQGLTSAGSLQVRGTTTLGAVGNVSISGGTSGQYLQTNGSGALTWSTVSLSNINNGTSNVSVAASGNITIASNGQGNIATFASNGTFATTTINDDVIVTGNLTVQGNTVSVNVTDLNVEDPIITEGRGINGAALSAADGKDRGLFSYYYDGGEKGAFIGIMTTGAHAGEYVVSTDAVVSNNVVTTSSYGNIVVGNVIGNLANGGTSVGIAGADANITMSVGENANVVVVDGLGINVNGKVTVGGTGIGGATRTTTSTDTVALVSIQDGAGLAVECLIKGADAAGTKFEVATLLLISDGAGTVDYTIYGVTSTSTSTGILSATKNGAIVELNVTPSSSNSTVWTVQYRSI